MTKCVLGDYILDMASGPFGSNLKVECFVPSGFPIIDGANLYGVRVTDNVTKFVTEEKARSLSRSIAKRHDVIVTISGTLGQVAYIPSDSLYEEYLCSQRQFRVTFDESKIDVEYLVNLLHTDYGQKKILSFANYVGVPALSQPLPNFRSIELELPDIEKQHKVAKIISTIDRKIALNRKRIATLEAMAKKIYDYWFVQFDFPNAHGRPYKSSGGAMVYNPDLKREIPKGWEVVPLGELISVCNGKDHKALSVGRIPVYGSGGIMRRVDQMLYEGESVLIPRKGTLNNIMYVNGPLWCIDTMFYTKPKVDNVMKYIFMTIKDWDFASMDTGSAVPSMTAGIINKLLVARPADVFLEKFENQMRPLFLGMSLSEREIAKLTSLRDFLLPVLMNGQVKAG